jgi:mutator protein MutT
VVEVAVALVWRQGCLLITRRRREAHLGGYWEFPGGKTLPGESPEACAEREVLEETGVACAARRCLPVIEYVYPERTVRLRPVECEYVGGPPRPLQVAEWAWVCPADLGRYEFPPANAPLLAELLGRG